MFTRVLLLVPPLNFRKSYKELQEEYTCDGSLPPLGLLYIHSVLTKAGHDVKIIDLSAIPFSMDDFRKMIIKYDPHVVGFSIIAESVNTTMCLADEIKKINPNCFIVAG
ncbi:MAG: cobalamin-dependent protein, partial [Candidatus Odinarchaeia archaeon]